MRIRELGEFGLIRDIARRTLNSKNVILGIGDDAAVVRWTPEKYLLLTTDMLIEDVHFRLQARVLPGKAPQSSAGPLQCCSAALPEGQAKEATAFQIGHKALAVNISDIAAMGGIPKYALISVGLRPNLPVRFARQIYQGIRSLADKYNIDIVGGDTDSSEKLIINIALTGEVEKKYLVTRKGARKGDLIFVTGSLGGSMLSRHLTFVPRLKEARVLVKQIKLTAMIDVSDGLSSDLMRLIEASQAGAVIYEKQIPVSRSAVQSARLRDIRPVEAALHDGEDFELLFTLSESEARKIHSGRLKGLNIPVHYLGRITGRGSGLKIVRENGRIQSLPVQGYQHFRI